MERAAASHPKREASPASHSDTPFLIIVALVAVVEFGGSAIIAVRLLASLP